MGFLPVDIIINQKAKEKHEIETLNLLAYVVLLVLLVITIWVLKKRKLCLHETGLAIIYGMIMGALIRNLGAEIPINSIPWERPDIPNFKGPWDYVIVHALNLGEHNETHLYAYEFKGEMQPRAELGTQISYASVDPEVFFNIILPPIVLNAGLSLKRRHFFRNIGAIFTYAFLGTVLSVGLVGYSIYGMIHLLKYFGYASTLSDIFSLTNCLQFGAIISPTDPLAVLAIFQELGVDLNLYALIFGESILNDAVSIVLTHSIDQISIVYGQSSHISLLATIWQCTMTFLSMFMESCLIGISFGVLSALTTKFTRLSDFPLLETSLLVLMSYLTFLTAEVIDASGIVAILLCGVTQAHYTINNLSFEARDRITKLFDLLTFLCENFLFLAVGVAIWQREQVWNLTFIIIASIAVLIARALTVYPLSGILNLGRHNKITMSFQHVIAWGGGARGVISYSLAARNTVGAARQIMLTTTTVIVIFSVISVGSSVDWMLRKLKIQVKSKEDKEEEERERERGCAGSITNTPAWYLRSHRKYPSSNYNHVNNQPSHRRQSTRNGSVNSTPVLSVEPNTNRSSLKYANALEGDSISHASCSTADIVNRNINEIEGDAKGDLIIKAPSTCPLTTSMETEHQVGLEDLNNQEEEEGPYDNASIVRRWRRIDNNFIKPLLTNSNPTLIDTLPSYMASIARMFTSDEQLARSRN